MAANDWSAASCIGQDFQEKTEKIHRRILQSWKSRIGHHFCHRLEFDDVEFDDAMKMLVRNADVMIYL